MKFSSNFTDSFLDPITGSMPAFNAGFVLKSPSDYFPNAQALDALKDGVLKNDNGVITIARDIPFFDINYTNTVIFKAPDLINTNVSWVMPNVVSQQGQVLMDVGAVESSTDRKLQFKNILPDGLQNNILAQAKDSNNNPIFVNATLSPGKVWIGNSQGYPQEATLESQQALDATYILQTPHPKLPNAQSLSSLSAGLLKLTSLSNALHIASPGSNTLLNDYVDPVTLQSFVAEKINASTVHFEDTVDPTTSLVKYSHVVGAGNLTAWNNSSNNKINLRLAETIHMDDHLTFLFDETAVGRDFTMKVHHTNLITQGVPTPFRINFYTQDRHLDLLQPHGDYTTTRGFFFESKFGYNGVFDEPSSFVLKVLKHRDDKTYFHQEDVIENILTYDRATESIYFNKPIHFDRKRLLMVADPEHDYDAVHKDYTDTEINRRTWSLMHDEGYVIWQ